MSKWEWNKNWTYQTFYVKKKGKCWTTVKDKTIQNKMKYKKNRLFLIPSFSQKQNKIIHNHTAYVLLAQLFKIFNLNEKKKKQRSFLKFNHSHTLLQITFFADEILDNETENGIVNRQYHSCGSCIRILVCGVEINSDWPFTIQSVALFPLIPDTSESYASLSTH